MWLISHVAVFPKLKMKRTDRNLQYSGVFFFLPEEINFLLRALSLKQTSLNFFQVHVERNRRGVSQPVNQRWEIRLQKNLDPQGGLWHYQYIVRQSSKLFVISMKAPTFQWLCLHVLAGEPKQFGLQNLKKYYPNGRHKHFGSSMCNRSNSAHVNKLCPKYIYISVINTNLHINIQHRHFPSSATPI